VGHGPILSGLGGVVGPPGHGHASLASLPRETVCRAGNEPAVPLISEHSVFSPSF
jgi:hypothetical protein